MFGEWHVQWQDITGGKAAKASKNKIVENQISSEFGGLLAITDTTLLFRGLPVLEV